MTCKKHPKYQALRQPTCECVECWQIWEAGRVVREREEQSKAVNAQMFRGGRMQL